MPQDRITQSGDFRCSLTHV